MSDKYIIRNCPAISFTVGCLNEEVKVWDCRDCIDCVLKQIVEKCKKEIRVYRDTLLPNDGTNTLHFGRQSFAYDILQLLDIEEVE